MWVAEVSRLGGASGSCTLCEGEACTLPGEQCGQKLQSFVVINSAKKWRGLLRANKAKIIWELTSSTAGGLLSFHGHILF